jgi:hypothetical protein
MRGCPLIAMYIGLKKRPRGQAAGGDEYASFLDAQSRTGTEREQRIEDLRCSDRSHITSRRSLGRSAIRDLGVSQNLRPPSSNSRRKTHRTRPPASKCDGRAAFDGSQCVCNLSLSHSALRTEPEFERTARNLAKRKASSPENRWAFAKAVTRSVEAVAVQKGTVFYAHHRTTLMLSGVAKHT